MTDPIRTTPPEASCLTPDELAVLRATMREHKRCQIEQAAAEAASKMAEAAYALLMMDLEDVHGITPGLDKIDLKTGAIIRAPEVTP